MPFPANVAPDPNWPPEAVAASKRYVAAAARLTDGSYWPILMFTTTNLFLWHLDAFATDGDPGPMFADAFNRGSAVLESVAASGVCGDHFPAQTRQKDTEALFEDKVSELFSDIWVGLDDKTYFDEPYEFTKVRFQKNGVDPTAFFGHKTVLDAGCGSGKFSVAIARFGASKVIGVDLGEKGLAFARAQAKKVSYGDRLEYLHGTLLDLPLSNASVDIVWSNGVVHHTPDYEKCLAEFARVLKPGGRLFLYVNGRFGLYELMWDTLRAGVGPIPRALFQKFLYSLGTKSGRIYWMMDCFYAPYEWKEQAKVEALLTEYGFDKLEQLTRGVAIDQIEQVSAGLPHAATKYGEAQLKYIATRI